jgi:transcriptional regulator GlxA family with amidase domain
VRQRWLIIAMKLMINTDMSMMNIAFACGFSSQQQLCCLCKSMLKMTPGATRDTHLQPEV